MVIVRNSSVCLSGVNGKPRASQFLSSSVPALQMVLLTPSHQPSLAALARSPLCVCAA